MSSTLARLALLAMAVPCLSGCLPLELDANEKGELLIARQEGFFLFDPVAKTVKPILGPGADEAIYARFSPDGKNFLAVFEEQDDLTHRFEMISLDGRSRRVLFKGQRGLSARFSPGGETLAVVRSSSREFKVKKEGKDATESREVPELMLVDVATGTTRKFRDVTTDRFVRWFADGKRLLALVLDVRNDEVKEANDRLRRGHLCEVDAATGAMKRIASVVAAGSTTFVNLSPDNRKALIVADGVGAAGENALPKTEKYKDPLVWEVDLATGGSRPFGHRAEFAIYSPNGKQVLLSARQDIPYFNKLVITAPDGTAAKILVTDCASNTATVMNAGPTLAGWRDNDTIHYFTNRSVYDSTRHTPWLKMASLRGAATALQPYVDIGALEAEGKMTNRRQERSRPNLGDAP